MANDHFEEYYAEKLWETIPSIYRHEDGIAQEPGVLRALVQVIARQAAILRRSQDSLWDDQFIELCDEWAVPYIGELLATRLLSEQNKRGRRIDVAKTIYYRRRKGTPRVLEELISDISGWEGKMVEQFQKIVRSRHGLDAKPQTHAGKFSGTLPGGCADLRNPRASELINGPFEEFFHIPDFRRHRGLAGRYSIPKLAFYLYRITVYEAIDVTPFSLGDGKGFSFDPSGRDIPLFSKASMYSDWNRWRPATEPELAAPIRCRLLGHATYFITEAIIQQLIDLPTPISESAAIELRQISGLVFKNDTSLLQLIGTFSNSAEILDPLVLLPLLSLALMEDCGKSVLFPDKESVLSNPLDLNSILVGFKEPFNEVITSERISSGNLLNWTTASGKDLIIDPENGRFLFHTPPEELGKIYIAYYYGFSGPIGAGSYERPWILNSLPDIKKTNGGPLIATDLLNDGITQIEDSKTYGPISSKMAIVQMGIQAVNKQRPYLRLESTLTLGTGTNKNSQITFDGLWIGSKGDKVAEIILKGNFKCVIIKNCTLDPGGSKNIKDEQLFPVKLIVDGYVENLCIESSIIGPVHLSNHGYIEETSIRDSIIQSVDSTINALEVKTGKTNIERSTIFGSIDVHRLYATEVIITSESNVTDTQNGCFRFGAAPQSSRLPHPFESFLFEFDTHHWFTSRKFGNPAYGQLSDTAPTVLKNGAENGSEMGAFSTLLNPIKFDGLKTKIEEYMPFGLIPIYIHNT
ncbi:hypothetical protein EI546_08980 [Aequorivita sp. H23M31]|uniref:Uncharacterized protein n=1 Tax=Aequorivita ciconiae TaxID=2494375 RepID=A0A410G3L0_9FLAO|nr:hypothetical protein [Aequorivita sp. H23M31]QAA81843.1 hypothetical protein EI546_08980 [Aequorivita sp. H23M31]